MMHVAIIHRQLIVKVLNSFSLLIILLANLGLILILTNISSIQPWYSLGILSGKISIILYALTLIPGMLRRYQVNHWTRHLLMMFRRQLGIMMFVLALSHYLLLKFWTIIKTSINFSTFEIMGLISLLLVLPLFLTSNDYSLKKLKQTWKKIHQLTYFAMFFIVLHVALQGFSFWSVFASLLLISNLGSYFFSRLLTQKETNI